MELKAWILYISAVVERRLQEGKDYSIRNMVIINKQIVVQVFSALNTSVSGSQYQPEGQSSLEPITCHKFISFRALFFQSRLSCRGWPGLDAAISILRLHFKAICASFKLVASALEILERCSCGWNSSIVAY